MEIRYRCPLHGIVRVPMPRSDDDHAPRTCPMTVRRRQAGRVETSTCGLPLQAELGAGG
jgi:hypothetical protein